MNPKIYPFISAGCLAGSAIGKQIIMRNSAELIAFRTLANNLIPQETAVIAPMLSVDILNQSPGNLRNTFWVNTLSAMAMGLLNIGCMHHFADILIWVDFHGLTHADNAALQAAFQFDYANIGLDIFMSSYTSLLFQTRHTGKAAAVIALSEGVSLIATVIAQYSLDAGLSGFTTANLLGTIAGVMLSFYFDRKTPPLGASLFNFSIPASESFWHKFKVLFQLGWPTWLAAFTENTVGTYSSFRFASVGLQGALNVLANACNDITEVVTDTFAPHISETNGNARWLNARAQMAWGIAPSVTLGIIGTLAAAPLSNAFTNDTATDSSKLYGNVALFMFGNILNNFVDILYSTFIDCARTKTPALLLVISDFVNLGLCFALEAYLSGDSNLVGNFATMITTLMALAGLGIFAYRERTTLFYDHEVGQAEALILIDVDTPQPPTDANQDSLQTLTGYQAL